MVRTGAAGVLDRLLDAGCPAASAWLAEACAKAGTERELFLAFALAPRRVGRAQVRQDQRLIDEAGVVPGWQPWRWTLDQVARARLLLAMPEAGPQALLRTLDRLFASAGLQELVALYQALPLLPHAPQLTGRAAEGIRSSMQAVFEAVALDNPYPQAHLDEPAWNQMVLKCLFVGASPARVVGLDARGNPRLMRMLLGYAHERWAAKRPVDPELWRCVGRFADADALKDLAKVLGSIDRREREAGALALLENGSAEARRLLDAASQLAEAAAGGHLSWELIAKRPA